MGPNSTRLGFKGGKVPPEASPENIREMLHEVAEEIVLKEAVSAFEKVVIGVSADVTSCEDCCSNRQKVETAAVQVVAVLRSNGMRIGDVTEVFDTAKRMIEKMTRI